MSPIDFKNKTPLQHELLAYLDECLELEQRGYVQLWGAVRSGKSVGAVMALLKHSDTGRKHNRYIVAGQSIRSVQLNIIPIFEQICEQFNVPFRHYRAVNNPHLVVRNTKFFVYGADNVRSQDSLRGFTSDGYLIDELSTIHPSFVSMADSRCSNAGAFRIITSNKTSPYSWEKLEYYDRLKSGEIEGLLIESKTEDNQHIKQDFILERKAEYKGANLARLIENKFAVPEGLIFPKIHVKDVKGPASLVAMDWGISGTTAAVIFSGPNIVDEYYYISEYQGMKLSEEHIADIIQKIHNSPNTGYPVDCYLPWIVDPSAVEIILRVKRMGIVAIPAYNNVEIGLQVTQHAWVTGATSVNPSCRNWLTESQGYRFRDLTDKPIKEFDHALSYCC